MRKLHDQLGRQFTAGFIFAIILVGCASVSFPYKYYNPQFLNYDGTLLGAKVEDDLPSNLCAPREGAKSPCVVMFTHDFFGMKSEFLDMQNRLQECQQPK
jgi:hypothetical protein